MVIIGHYSYVEKFVRNVVVDNKVSCNEVSSGK